MLNKEKTPSTTPLGAFLNLHLHKPCFSKAHVCWKGVFLNGPPSPLKPLVDLSQEDLSEVLFDLFQKLDFVPLARLYAQVQSIETLRKEIRWEDFFKKQGFFWSEKTQNLLEEFNQSPLLFQQWALDKKLSLSDLAPLCSLKKNKVFFQLTPFFSSQGLSRSQGRQVLDLLADLIPMDSWDIQTLEPPDRGDWWTHLYGLRNPETKKRDENFLDHSSPWPQFVQIRVQRLGDQRVRKMEIQYSSFKDLGEKLYNLSQIHTQQINISSTKGSKCL